MPEASQKPCMNCRRRKVRCNKQTPCANCVRSNTRCIYDEQSEGETFAPLVLDKPATMHLFDRLSGLEKMVSNLSSVHSQSNRLGTEAKDTRLQIALSRASIPGEVEKFPFIESQNGPPLSEAPFPSRQESNMLIQFFLEVTEPFIKLIHIPFFHKQLADYRAGEGENPIYFESTLHCIHALTLSTLSSDFVLDFFHHPRDDLLAILRKTAESALAKAEFMRTHQPNVLRALLYFINFLFEIGDIEYASSLVGVAIRTAFRIGLHHDWTEGPPFVRDLRRRLWFHVQHVDHRAASLLGVPSTLKPEWDTPPPSNAFDATWEPFRTADPTFTGEPGPMTGFTDTSFVLARAEIETIQTQIRSSSMSFPAMSSHITSQQTSIQQVYLTNSGTHPLQRFMLGLISIHLSAVHLSARQLHHKIASSPFRDGTFLAGIELLESISALEDDMELTQFAWMLRAFQPIQAIVTVLTCTLFKSTPECEARAWRQIDRVYARYDNADCQLARSAVFEPVNALREQALEGRIRGEGQMEI